ncbi:MAG: MBL fold metallo-hydrolase [Myxococcaceae bacterium]|nr:MBL fold metallo-hydrolase [Myxococcaceae bacterium]
MPVELKRGGLHVTGTPLWLDARRKSELSFVSHAHSDHIARHQRTIATEATSRLMAHRLGPLESVLTAPYRKRFTLGALELELLPAGHVLGSAQLKVTRDDGHRLAYTGDFTLDRLATAEPAVTAECDTLVMEATFGSPRFRFPARAQVFDEVEAWARRALSRGVHPILYAYSLGKSQEAIAQLNARGLKVCVHPSIFAVTEIYRAFGVAVEAREFDGTLQPDEVGVFPPFGKSPALKRLTPKVTAVLTGWAIEPWAARRSGADVAFPISDHADFPSLLRYAKATGAREVVTVHGFAEELAAALRKEGVFARAATQAVQLELFGRSSPAQTELGLR